MSLFVRPKKSRFGIGCRKTNGQAEQKDTEQQFDRTTNPKCANKNVPGTKYYFLHTERQLQQQYKLEVGGDEERGRTGKRGKRRRTGEGWFGRRSALSKVENDFQGIKNFPEFPCIINNTWYILGQKSERKSEKNSLQPYLVQHSSSRYVPGM